MSRGRGELHAKHAPRESKTGAQLLSPKLNLGRVPSVRQLRAFRQAYREAMAQWVQGNREVVFPAGTLQMHTLHHVRVAPS